jgi:hypothetical protein
MPHSVAKTIVCFAAVLAVCSICCVCSTADSARPPSVQFANIAPLPGAGSALASDGTADGLGALQINIPAAYTPGSGYVNVGAYSGQYIKKFGGERWGNGSGFVGVGLGRWPRAYVSAMAVSRLVAQDSKAVNAQVQLLEETPDLPALAVGFQDLFNKEFKDFRNVANTEVSYYFTATKSFKLQGLSVFGTFGAGRGRFCDNVFAGISSPLSDSLNLAVEYDGFQINEAIAWRPQGRYGKYTLLAGYNGKAGPLLGAQFTGRMSEYWSIPILLFLSYQQSL